jgi:hypothetical protein
VYATARLQGAFAQDASTTAFNRLEADVATENACAVTHDFQTHAGRIHGICWHTDSVIRNCQPHLSADN